MKGQLTTFQKLRAKNAINFRGGCVESFTGDRPVRGSLVEITYYATYAPYRIVWEGNTEWITEKGNWFRKGASLNSFRFPHHIQEFFVGPFRGDAHEIYFMVECPNGNTQHFTLYPPGYNLSHFPRDYKELVKLRTELIGQ